MRRGNDIKVLINEKPNEFVGICLGADYCAEHEWGIKGLKSTFGIPSEGTGIQKRTITKLPPIGISEKVSYGNVLHYFSIGEGKKAKHYLVYCSDHSIQHTIEKKEHYELHLFKNYRNDGEDRIDYHMATAWDEGSFGILVDHTLKPYLDELWAAFQKKDITIFLGGAGPFKNAGLSICIASHLPEEVRKLWMDADLDAIKLKNASDAIGIEGILKKAGKEWMSLRPSWVSDKKAANTIYDVHYWLNPMNQQQDNYGWYTVEDLMLWAVGNGPIPMKNNQKKK